MYLRKVANKKTGRIYLSIVQSYRDKDGKPKSKTKKSLGYLDELEKDYDDPISFFTKEAERMTLEENATQIIQFNPEERIEINASNRKNFGYVALSKIYHELEIDKFLVNRQRHKKFNYDVNSIMKLLVFSRLLNPSSKKKAFENKEWLFEKTNFSLDDIYRSLPFFDKHKKALQQWINERIQQQYNRDTSLVYYDVTNYYFEIDEPDDFRKKGFSKERRTTPIVQMGLFMDTMGIPISYQLFEGNVVDKSTFVPAITEVQKNYDLGKIIVVADKGMTTGDNIWKVLSAKNGYVLSYSVRGSGKKFKDYILDEIGYEEKSVGFKIKSRIQTRDINVTQENGKKKKVEIEEKQVIFYNEKYAKKAREDRAKTLEKAKDLVANPDKYTKATTYGAAKYIKNIKFDSKTGEILEDVKAIISYDEEKVKNEEALDGYYAIISSELNESDEKIIEIYRGLWKIEESFKLTKTDLESRPVYLSKKDHIEAHFLTCFIALVIGRVLEHRLNGKYYLGKMIESLQKASCSYVEENCYLFNYYDEVLQDIGAELEIDFSKKYVRLREIKKVLGEVKKK